MHLNLFSNLHLMGIKWIAFALLNPQSCSCTQLGSETAKGSVLSERHLPVLKTPPLTANG